MSVYSLGDAVDFVRSHRSMYLPADVRPLDETLVLQLVSDMLALGVIDFEVLSVEDWRLVGSDTDWLRLGAAQVGSPLDLFDRVVPLVEAGQNSVRHEIVVRAFAQQVAIGEGPNLAILGSKEKPAPGLLAAYQRLGKYRVVAFLAR